MPGRTLTTVTLALLVGVFASFLYVRPGTTLPANVQDGFSDEPVVDVPLPTALDFAPEPDGRMFVASKPGQLYAYKDGQRAQILDISTETCSNVARGLLGVAADPQFGTADNNFVYLYYTYKKYGRCPQDDPTNRRNPVNRVSRFEMNGNTVDKDSEKVLVNNIPAPNGNHDGGDVKFGKDGNLYVSIGDGACDYAERNSCQYQNDASRYNNVLLGKILRITPDGGIPPDNPYSPNAERAGNRCNLASRTARGNNCQETYLKGFRNPFRFAVDPDSPGTRLFINDVGGKRWEEIDEAVVGPEDAGNDYGWNVCEGNNDNPQRDGRSDCSGSRFTGPIHEYNHSTGCESLSGGAFVPDAFFNQVDDPSYLFGDYVCGKIFKLTPNETGSGYTSTEFASGLGPGGPIAMDFGPGGEALYYTTFADGGQVPGQVRRISPSTN